MSVDKTENEKKMDRLRAPFSSDVIEWRVQQAGARNGGKLWANVLAYIDNRAIMNRLDRVMGAENWRNEYKESPAGGGVLCGLSLRFGDEWVTKWDGAENTDIEAIKGGLSGSMKRAAVQWGMGRYLYRLESKFVDIIEKTEYDRLTDATKKKYKRIYQKAVPSKNKPKIEGWWKPPALPDFARPKAESEGIQD